MASNDDVQELGPSAEEEEYEEVAAARYDEVIAKCKLLRSRLFMNNETPENVGDRPNHSENLSVIECLDEMEEQLNRLSIHEDMLKGIKLSKLAYLVCNSNEPFNGLDDLLKAHCANQAKMFELSKSIIKERLAQQKASSELLDQLIQYTASLKNGQEQSSSSTDTEGDSDLQLKQNLEKSLQEIRFMQVSISQIIAKKHLDLLKEEKFRAILESARNPINDLQSFM